MQELYRESRSVESVSGEEKQLGFRGKIVHIAGVFLFYILLFGSISLVSHGFNFFSQPETVANVTFQGR